MQVDVTEAGMSFVLNVAMDLAPAPGHEAACARYRRFYQQRALRRLMDYLSVKVDLWAKSEGQQRGPRRAVVARTTYRSVDRA